MSQKAFFDTERALKGSTASHFSPYYAGSASRQRLSASALSFGDDGRLIVRYESMGEDAKERAVDCNASESRLYFRGFHEPMIMIAESYEEAYYKRIVIMPPHFEYHGNYLLSVHASRPLAAYRASGKP